jgi:hypothetical protein
LTVKTNATTQFEDWAREFEGNLSNVGPREPAMHNAEFEAAFARQSNVQSIFCPLFKESINVFDFRPKLDWQDEFIRQEGVHPQTMDAELEKAFAMHSGPAQHDPFEKEWTEQFTALSERLGDVKGKGKAVVDQDDVSWRSEFEKFAALNVDGEGEEKQGEWMSKFSEIWKGMQNRELEEDFGQDWGREFEDNSESGKVMDPDPVTAPCAPYKFEMDNPFLSHENPLQEGLNIVSTGGSLSQAALSFEAAVQRDAKNSDAWMHLGVVQAENEKEGAAIAALQRSVQENPNNLTSLMVMCHFLFYFFY